LIYVGSMNLLSDNFIITSSSIVPQSTI
jgi:hypothetical protein